MTNALVHFGLDDSTFWVIAAVLQLVSNHFGAKRNEKHDYYRYTCFRILDSRHNTFDTETTITEQNVSFSLLIGSILFLVSYLIKPAGPTI